MSTEPTTPTAPRACDCYAEPLTIGFQVPEPSSDDIKFITILGKSLEMFKHLPPKHLRAAVKWFSDYADAKIDGYQEPPKPDHSA